MSVPDLHTTRQRRATCPFWVNAKVICAGTLAASSTATRAPPADTSRTKQGRRTLSAHNAVAGKFQVMRWLFRRSVSMVLPVVEVAMVNIPLTLMLL
jgi:hypothetical protein